MGLSRFVSSSGSQGEFDFGGLGVVKPRPSKPKPSEPGPGEIGLGEPSVTLNGKLRAGVIVQDTVTGHLLGGHPTGEPAGIYDIPKGQVDEGEDVREAAARELQEETGISVPSSGLVYLGRFPLRKGEIELFYVAMPVDVASLHCDSIIDNPFTPERIGLPEMDGFKLLHRNDQRGYRWMRAIEGLIRLAAPKFPRLRRGVVSSAGSQPWVVIYRGEDGSLGWVKVSAGTVSEARKQGRAYGPVQLVLTVQGVKDILHGRSVEYETVNEELFEFIRNIRLVPVSSHYSVGGGSASGQYAVVDDETGEVVSYQDSLGDAEAFVQEENDRLEGVSRFPLSAIFRGFAKAKDFGYRGSVREWMRDMGVAVSQSAHGGFIASQAVPATKEGLAGYVEGDAELERLLNTPIKDMPRYRFLLADEDFKQFGDRTLGDAIFYTVNSRGFESFFSVSGSKVVGFYAFKKVGGSISNIKAFSLGGEQSFNATLARDLSNLVSNNVMRYNIEWLAVPGNEANDLYRRMVWWYGADDPTQEVIDGVAYLHYFIPAGSVKQRSGHRKGVGDSFRSEGGRSSVGSVLDLRKGDLGIPSSVAQAEGVTKNFVPSGKRGCGVDPAKVEDGRWEGELIDSATARELLEANDNPNFYHRAEHLAATKEQGDSEIVRAYANTLELRTKSEHFKKNNTYYRQWVLLKDFRSIAKDKKIPIEDAIDYSLNFGDVTVRCSCPSQLWHGFSYMGDQLGYLYGLPREKRFPKIRNPQLQNATCFVGGTPVLTDSGLRSIESVKEGDLVWTHKGRLCRVSSTMVAKKQIISVIVQEEVFGVTPEHPFLADPVKELWLPFSKATKEDRVFSPWLPGGLFSRPIPTLPFANGFWSASLSVVKDYYEEVVYNLSVEEDESYLIGEGCWAVHNCKHVHMALEEILGSKEKIVKMFSEYYKRLPEVPKDTMIAIPAPKAGVEEAEPEVTEFEETGDVDVVLPEPSMAEPDLSPEVISTGDPESPGTIYVDTRLTERGTPEGRQVKYAGEDGDEGQEDEGMVDSIPPVESVSEEEVQALGDAIDEASVSPRSDDERFTTEWVWESAGRAHGC
jgi:8-oxo-dGTP pyrophosphatase MutT (NUDIX family)